MEWSQALEKSPALTSAFTYSLKPCSQFSLPYNENNTAHIWSLLTFRDAGKAAYPPGSPEVLPSSSLGRLMFLKKCAWLLMSKRVAQTKYPVIGDCDLTFCCVLCFFKKNLIIFSTTCFDHVSPPPVPPQFILPLDPQQKYNKNQMKIKLGGGGAPL